jgi:hypothetical protein
LRVLLLLPTNYCLVNRLRRISEASSNAAGRSLGFSKPPALLVACMYAARSRRPRYQ